MLSYIYFFTLQVLSYHKLTPLSHWITVSASVNSIFASVYSNESLSNVVLLIPNKTVNFSKPNCFVAYRPAAKQWLGKQRPLLRNARNIHAHNNRATAFSMWSTPRPLIWNGPVNTPLQKLWCCVFCVVLSENYLEDNWRYSLIGARSPDSNGLSTEAGDSSLLRFVTRKHCRGMAIVESC
jgi:hypothetical protein